MAIHYPNGRPYLHDAAKPAKKQEKRNRSVHSFGNRGMSFEEAINESNQYYLLRDMAVIHKKPTPIQVVKVDYPKRSAAKIVEAYYTQSSTTDYNGVYRGYYIDFEAKETKNKTSFPLKNFHDHQIRHMQQCQKQAGICFVLFWFSSLERCFLLGAESLFGFWEDQTKRKSIPLQYFEDKAYEIKVGIAPRIPYLLALDDYIKEFYDE